MNHQTKPPGGGDGCCGGGGGGHGGHGGHEGHGGMEHMMSMSFHFGYKETVLFEWWKVTTINELVVAAFIVGVAAILYEGLKFSRDILLQSQQAKVSREGSSTMLSGCREPSFRQSVCSTSHFFQTLLHALQFTVSYLLMLVFMTYNVWLCLAVVVGTTIGYYLFGWRNRVGMNCDEHCH